MAGIGFLGLGNMGGPMAANLVKAGHRVRGYDPAPSAVADARLAGVEVVEHADKVAAGAEVLVTMLPSGKHVLDLYRALLGSAEPGTLFLDCSTIDVAGARLAHELARGAGMAALDAPGSGGGSGAGAGTLTFMVGGSAEAVERAAPVLSAMGRKVVHCGPAGTGQAAKICNNLLLGASMIAASEAFVLGEALGISAQALYDVMSTSSGQCWSVTSYCPVAGPVPASPANRGYQPGFSVGLMLKDLKLAADAASAEALDLPLGRHARDLYAAFAAAGNSGKDFSAIIQSLRAEANHA